MQPAHNQQFENGRITVFADSNIERITRSISLTCDLINEQRQRLLEITDKYPVHRALEKIPKLLPN